MNILKTLLIASMFCLLTSFSENSVADFSLNQTGVTQAELDRMSTIKWKIKWLDSGKHYKKGHKFKIRIDGNGNIKEFLNRLTGFFKPWKAKRVDTNWPTKINKIGPFSHINFRFYSDIENNTERHLHEANFYFSIPPEGKGRSMFFYDIADLDENGKKIDTLAAHGKGGGTGG